MQINTIEEMELLYYSDAGLQALNQLGEAETTANFVSKAAGPVTTSTTGVYNAVFGAQAWSQLNQESNAFGVLPKVPWGRSGIRVKSARANTLPTAGVSESGTIPTTAVPTYNQISTKPKLAALAFDNTEMQEYLATQSDDDMYAAMAQLRNDIAIEHAEDINNMLLTDYNTAAGNMFESIDRVTASSTETSDCSYTSGRDNIYGITRSSNTWFNAQTLDNSATNRNLTDALIRKMDRLIGVAGGNTQLILTKQDTLAAVAGLYGSQVRYNPLGEKLVAPSVNGLTMKEGIPAAVRVVSVYGYPLIVSKDVKIDGIGRMYFLDTSNPEGFDIPRLCIKVAKPTQYFEAGINQGTPFAINAFGNRGLYRTMGELICSFPAAQGKLRDLQ